MQKEHTLLILVVVLALALVSCARPAQEPAEAGPGGSEQEAAAEPTATSVPETEEQKAEPTEEESQETEAGTPEEAESSLAEVADVNVLDSYRQTITVRTQEAGGEPEELTYVIEAVREPPARHTVMSAKEGGESRQVTEIIQIGNMQYMRIASVGGDSDWMTMAADEELVAGEAMGDMALPSADEFMDDEACEMVGTEKVSGLETRHYRCDLDFMEDDELSFTEAKADVWVSTKYNLPIKVEATYTGKGSDDQDTTWETEQVIDMINEPIDIQPPEGVSETGLPDDIPLMESATGLSNLGSIVTFKTPETVEQVTAFYKEEMPKQGWTEDEEQGGIPGYFGFTKGDRVANFMVAGGDGPSDVTIMLQK
ncbi:MAG: hypothetical protein U9R48_09620 [Chloroflexota bacterium]|nr:hypothetical protein [Chloroflexota bacterium]